MDPAAESRRRELFRSGEPTPVENLAPAQQNISSSANNLYTPGLKICNMPDRIARSSVAVSKSVGSRKKPGKRGGKRSLDAYFIANREDSSGVKIQRHRLGETEDDGSRNKRRRTDDGSPGAEDEQDASELKRPARKKSQTARQNELDISEGSDSEGHVWAYGRVNSDEDSDIDSDEAFDEEDEERFAGFTFRGSSKGKPKTGQKTKAKASPHANGVHDGELADISLDEHAGRELSEDEDSLGEDAIDLATALDQYVSSGNEDDEEDEEEAMRDKSDSASSGSEVEETDASSPDSEMESDDEDEEKLARLEDLVSAIHPAEPTKPKRRELDRRESQKPSATGITSEKFDVRDLFDAADPSLRDAAQKFTTIPRAAIKKDLKLTPQLPKRHQDKIDRQAASKKASETLARWDDTVKQNRMAEHLSFPIVDENRLHQVSSKQLSHNVSTAPMNELESAIQNILEESGLGKEDRNSGEESEEELTGLSRNRLSMQEVTSERARLRQQRELLSREEARAKRIKKIKSKSYRRVHRRERERLTEMQRDAVAEGTDLMDGEEREAHDRRRAEERMGSKHKNSKWVKQMKKSGRTIWDEGARSGVVEMARRDEELRERMDGEDVRRSDEEAFKSGESEESSDDESVGGDPDAAELRAIRRRLDRESRVPADDGSGSRLAQMSFMKEAQAKRRQENNETLKQIRKELYGDASSSSESEKEEMIGRKVFGPSSNEPKEASDNVVRNPFEAPGEGDSEDEFVGFDEGATRPSKNAATHGRRKLGGGSHEPLATAATTIKTSSSRAGGVATANGTHTAGTVHGGANGRKPLKKEKTAMQKGQAPEPELLSREKHSRPDTDGWVTVTYDQASGDESEPESEVGQAEIIRRAFAGDDVEFDFDQEKAEAMNDEDEKVIDNKLPGWGTWVGDGLSKREKREQKRNRGRFLTKQEGIKPEDRKDKKLRNVIINHRRIKNNVGYMATVLPFPFTDRREYERSIRMPSGNEWNTSGIHQKNIKPRILVKPGQIITPMEQPKV